MAELASRPPAWFPRLIEPWPTVLGREARRRARYTALCFVLLLFLGLVALGVTVVTPDPGSSRLESATMLSGLLVLVALYPLSRGPRYAIASYVAVAIVSLGIWVPWLMNGGKDTTILYFACIPLIMAGLLVGTRASALFAGFHVSAATGVAPVLILHAAAPVSSAITVPLFLVFVGGFAVNAARLRERDLQEVEDLARELEAHERRRVAMLNNIAHDLGSPLTPLRLQVAMVPADKPVAPERLAIMKRNLAQVERLVSDIKDLARAEAGGFKLHQRAVDLAELVRAAATSFQADADARGIRLAVDAPPTIPRVADPERVTQVLYNLITNALKFTPSGGEVRIVATREGREVRIRVADTGRGLAPEDMARLFQPFSQVHARDEVKERGSGLGLYIARSLARAHGGELSAESEGRGRGATFTLQM